MLDAGSVIYFEVTFRSGPRNKFLIVLDVDTVVYVLTINTEIHEFFGRGEFGECYVTIDHATHPFLDRDSHIDCNEVIQLKLEDVVAELRSDNDCLRGMISDDVRQSVITAIRRTPCLSRDDKDRYIRCLN